MKAAAILGILGGLKAALVGAVFAALERPLVILAATRAARMLTTPEQIEPRLEIFRICCGGNPPRKRSARAEKAEKRS